MNPLDDRLTTDPVTGQPYYRKAHPMTDYVPPVDDDDPMTPVDDDRGEFDRAMDAHFGPEGPTPEDYEPLGPADYSENHGTGPDRVLRARHTVQRRPGVGSLDRDPIAGEDRDDHALRCK